MMIGRLASDRWWETATSMDGNNGSSSLCRRRDRSCGNVSRLQNNNTNNNRRGGNRHSISSSRSSSKMENPSVHCPSKECPNRTFVNRTKVRSSDPSAGGDGKIIGLPLLLRRPRCTGRTRGDHNTRRRWAAPRNIARDGDDTSSRVPVQDSDRVAAEAAAGHHCLPPQTLLLKAVRRVIVPARSTSMERTPCSSRRSPCRRS
mmetsp:Transcript_32263/g.78082  ORF Transcript_32263/g.78082 Transcript_32263/m.78082 type:complete len:203 (+) Transcript_32263:930-1538(+)